MKEFQISRYMKKLLPFIIVVCVALTVGVYVFLTSSQTYVASTVIRYDYEGAEDGLTPLGAKLDVNEIKSSSVMSKVAENLSLNSKQYSIDSLISRIKVEDVIDEDEQTRKTALLDEGEEYTEEPTTFVVSFEAKGKEGMGFARSVLDETLNVYFSDFGARYYNYSSTTNTLSNLSAHNYDYIIMMDIIDESITKTIDTLYKRAQSDQSFRSTHTGMSFSELASEFDFIRSVNVSALYSEILDNQITKDKKILLADYSERIKENKISNQAEEGKISDVVKIIDAYVQKMRESGNTNITYEYILDEVYEKDYALKDGTIVGNGDQTVTYDELIYSWKDHKETKEYNTIQSAYYQYIIDVFNNCKHLCSTGEEPSKCGNDAKTCTQIAKTQEYEKTKTSVEEKIADVVESLNVLYDLAEKTNEEYNEYLGAQNISILSSVAVNQTVNVPLYMAIAIVFLIIVCCCGAIFIGRLNDIVRYIFYTDHLTGFENRTAFDQYLKHRDKMLLDDGVVCATMFISNQGEINRRLGRDGGNDVIKYISEVLKEVFARTNAEIFYNGNMQFIAVVEKTEYITVEYIMHRISLILEKRENFTSIDIAYEMGIAETSQNGVHKMRGLLTKAVGNQNKYVAKATEPKKETTEV